MKDGEYVVDIEFTYTVRGVITCSRHNPDCVAAAEWVEDRANHEEVLASSGAKTVEMKADRVSIKLSNRSSD